MPLKVAYFGFACAVMFGLAAAIGRRCDQIIRLMQPRLSGLFRRQDLV